MTAKDKVLEIARQEIGYLEKRSNSQLDSKTANAGSGNYTKYARDLYPSLQGQPWCDMFVDWCFVQAFGPVEAKQLLGGGFSAYTPTSAQYFKNKGQYHENNPQPGDQIFFRGSDRINHTGIVTEVTLTKVRTIEGNTSAGAAIVPNGGAVCQKEYSLDNTRIDGYGRPDWSLVDKPTYEIGWHHDLNGWWYAYSSTDYHKSCWQTINHHKYYFNEDGYALTDWHQIGGKWYYFEPEYGHPLECAMYVAPDGEQRIGEF